MLTVFSLSSPFSIASVITGIICQNSPNPFPPPPTALNRRKEESYKEEAGCKSVDGEKVLPIMILPKKGQYLIIN